MINVSAVIAIIISHYIGDWFLQSRKMAMNKSKNFWWLIAHLSILSLTISIASLTLGLSSGLTVTWVFINLICHGIQDWNIWRSAENSLSKTCKVESDVYYTKLFWDIVGIDCSLHYCVYFLSYWILTKFA